MALRLTPLINNAPSLLARAMSSGGGRGDGIGKGGGSGGSIRDAGGAFGRMEAAREDEYIYKQTKHQLEELKKHLKKEIDHHEAQLNNHKQILERHKSRVAELEELSKPKK